MQLPGRAGALWQRVRDSLWFIPGVLTAWGALLRLASHSASVQPLGR